MLKALNSYPLCRFFLRDYVEGISVADLATDEQHHVSLKRILLRDTNLIPNFESLFDSALKVLGISREQLKTSSEFNLNSYNPENLEGFLGLLRGVVVLAEEGYTHIKLLNAPSEADVLCERRGSKTCVEVKTISYEWKRVSSRRLQLESTLVQKLNDILPTARRQLSRTKSSYACNDTMFIAVVNWLGHSAVLDQRNYQTVVNRLESETPHLNKLKGVDWVVFVTYFGQRYIFQRVS